MASTELYPTKSALESAFKLARNAKIPRLPEVVRALQDELAKPEPELARAADLVAQDLAITGKLLKTINSPAFGLTTKVSSIQQAASLMGLERLSNLVAAEAVNRLMETTAGPALVLWEAMKEEASLMAGVAHVLPGLAEDEAYLFGMLHDVGSLIFAARTPDYGTMWSLHGNCTPRKLLSYEAATFDVDHCTLGFLLAGHWQLPEHISLAVLHHHTEGRLRTDDTRIKQLVALSKLAHYLGAVMIGTEEASEMHAYREDAWQELDISDNDWAELRDRASHGQLAVA